MISKLMCHRVQRHFQKESSENALTKRTVGLSMWPPKVTQTQTSKWQTMTWKGKIIFIIFITWLTAWFYMYRLHSGCVGKELIFYRLWNSEYRFYSLNNCVIISQCLLFNCFHLNSHISKRSTSFKNSPKVNPYALFPNCLYYSETFKLNLLPGNC